MDITLDSKRGRRRGFEIIGNSDTYQEVVDTVVERKLGTDGETLRSMFFSVREDDESILSLIKYDLDKIYPQRQTHVEIVPVPGCFYLVKRAWATDDTDDPEGHGYTFDVVFVPDGHPEWLEDDEGKKAYKAEKVATAVEIPGMEEY